MPSPSKSNRKRTGRSRGSGGKFIGKANKGKKR